MKELISLTNDEIVEEGLCIIAQFASPILELIDFKNIKVTHTNSKDCLFNENGLFIDTNYYKSINKTNIYIQYSNVTSIIFRSMISYMGRSDSNYEFNQDKLDEYYTFLIKDRYEYFEEIDKHACFIKESCMFDSVMDNKIISNFQNELMKDEQNIENVFSYVDRNVIRFDKDFIFSLEYEIAADSFKINTDIKINLLKYFEYVYEENKYVFSSLIRNKKTKLFIMYNSKNKNIRSLIFSLV